MAVGGSTRCFTLWLWVLMVSAFDLVDAKPGKRGCVPSSCGHIHNISYPFRLKDDPQHCGESLYTLYCENNVTILHLQRLHLPSAKFYVQAINYNNRTIRAVDPGIQKDNCSSIPSYPISGTVINENPYFVPEETFPLYFLKCRNSVNSFLYVDTAPCFNDMEATSSSQPKTYGYVKVKEVEMGDLKAGCSIERMTLVFLSEDWDASYKYIHNALVYGFELRFYYEIPFFCGGQWSISYICYPRNFPGTFRFLWRLIHDILGRYIDVRTVILFCGGLLLLGRFMFGAPTLMVFLIHKWRRRHLSMYNTIEEFLHAENNLVPIRYSYSDIKKMSNKFKDKLGEGGYGCVFKGKLRSGRSGAIKMLGKSKANGEEFISEVATIGRIHHVNVVKLIGYCVEGTKRALVYEFMPNGSLDKYIFSKEGSISLTFKQIYEISLGVARGIEYLHQGCEMQILHFDIKPHNILLDQNFIPKISDFGLAKLYPTDNSIVSLTAARGTLGYIAPELFYKNIGGVSYKADVYSFGMLLMEMASKRKNLNAVVEHPSQIYFPSWVYDQFSVGKDHLEMVDVTEEERMIIKKMVITALWCIQLKPSQRPSMDKVIEMLVGDIECLQMPAKPSLNPHENS
ncbi:rust resistance kinase Lr10 isoform X2 [Rosa chinensis]|uniref:rust resistance kinase Lr10 isoform X2 n=1 Tax=Rosa chinensis TaxID=74649 RepID=UPI001AD8F23F|nr:rust resistance kinase Lr10 isoform X2 [Rosa chinensis]